MSPRRLAASLTVAHVGACVIDFVQEVKGVTAPETTPDGPPRLEVHVQGPPGSVPARAFLEVLRHSLDALEEIDRGAGASKSRPGKWLIAELRNESAAAVLWRPDTPELPTAGRLVSGLNKWSTSEGLPDYLSSRVATSVIKIGELLRRRRVDGVSYRVPGAIASESPQAQEARLTDSVVTHARASIEGVERALGSVTGVLDVVNLRRGAQRVSLYNESARRAVQCHFTAGAFDAVRDALGRRVVAEGTVTRNRQGQILSVEIEALDTVPDSSDAPSVDELVGIAPWYTGDKSTDEFLRWVRHG